MIQSILTFFGRKRFSFVDVVGLFLLAAGFGGIGMTRGARALAFFLAFGLFGIASWVKPRESSSSKS